MTDPVMTEVADAIGVPAAIKLTRAFAGGRLRLPGDAEAIGAVIGYTLADGLCSRLGEREIAVTWSRMQLIPARNAAVVTAYAETGNVSAIARENLISRRMVRKILRRAGVKIRRPMVPL